MEKYNLKTLVSNIKQKGISYAMKEDWKNTCMPAKILSIAIPVIAARLADPSPVYAAPIINSIEEKTILTPADTKAPTKTALYMDIKPENDPNGKPFAINKIDVYPIVDANGNTGKPLTTLPKSVISTFGDKKIQATFPYGNTKEVKIVAVDDSKVKDTSERKFTLENKPYQKETPMNLTITPLAEAEVSGLFGGTNEGSKTQYGVDMLQFTSKGSDVSIEGKGNAGVTLNNFTDVFVPFDVAYNILGRNNTLQTVGNIGKISKYSDLEILAGIGAGLKVNGHNPRLAITYKNGSKSFNETYDILTMDTKTNAQNLGMLAQYLYKTDKGDKIADVSLEMPIVNLSGSSDIKTLIPGVGTTEDKTKYTKGGFNLDAALYVPVADFISLKAKGALNNVIEETKYQDGTSVKSNYTQMTLGGGAKFKVIPYVPVTVEGGYTHIISGSSNGSDLNKDGWFAKIAVSYDINDQTALPKPATQTAKPAAAPVVPKAPKTK